MVKRCGGSRGQVAPLVAVILAVLALVTVAAVTLAHGQKRAGVYYGDRVQAYYTAEDGVEEVLAGIFNDWEALAGIPLGPDSQLLHGPGREGWPEVRGCQQPMAGGGVKLRLQSTGRYRNAVRHVLFEAVLYPPVGYGPAGPEGAAGEDRPPGDPAPEPETGVRMDIEYWGDMYHPIYGRMKAGG